MSISRLGLVLMILAAMLVGNACRTEPAPEPPAQDEQAADTPLSVEEVTALQESLGNYLEPGTFRAELRGSPFDEDAAAMLADPSLEGTASSADTTSEDGSRRGLRFVLQSASGTTALHLTVQRLTPSPNASGPLIAADTYEQQPSEEPPFVSAQMHQAGSRFVSRNGTLIIDAVTEEGVQGRFYFEMQQPGNPEQDEWISLVGVFDTGVASAPAETM